MMGIIAEPSDNPAVHEFFELFKTPWEIYRANRQYDVVLCAADVDTDNIEAKLLIIYSGRKISCDETRKRPIRSYRHASTLSYGAIHLPLFGNNLTFYDEDLDFLVDAPSRESVVSIDQRRETVLLRVGYDLFREIHTLLTVGQPLAVAGTPTLEIHIALVRDAIVGRGLPLVEIPPVPDGYPFITCLTHDIDHPSLRRHLFDYTMFGFIYRAIIGSVVDVVRSRVPLRKLATNWYAAAKLPFIYLGLAKDFWSEFESYVDLDKGWPSTYFVIPYEGYAGITVEGKAPVARASHYDITHIVENIHYLTSAGCEIGLHGIDAWIDSSKGRDEARRIFEYSGIANVGVRMHWLYMKEDSPTILENGNSSTP